MIHSRSSYTRNAIIMISKMLVRVIFGTNAIHEYSSPMISATPFTPSYISSCYLRGLRLALMCFTVTSVVLTVILGTAFT